MEIGTKEYKATSIAMIIAAVWAGLAILISIGLSPWFSWWHNAISDLGVSAVAPLFNSALIICGITAVIFSVVHLNYEKESKIGLAGSFMLLLASISLIGIGVFTEDFPPYHFIFSVLFFVFILFTCLIFSAKFIPTKKYRWIGVYALIIGIIGITAWALPIWDGVAIPEAITIFPSIAFAVILSTRIIIEVRDIP
ncbi:MAG: DUF998 domain-containing protein [Candidatus Odinarchaeia archaeon]